MEFEKVDFRILNTLQSEGKLTNQELAERVGISASPCWRHVKRLEEQGVIRGYQAVIDRKAVGLGVLAFVLVQIDTHSHEQAMRFESDVRQLKEVVACYSITGQADFLLHIVSSDMDTYAEFAMTVIRRLPGIKGMHTMMVLKEIKPLSALPVGPV